MNAIYRNEELEKLVKEVKKVGYKVYTFKSSSQFNPKIEQIFIVDQENRICTVYTKFGGLNYGSIHKPCRSAGTGFGLFEEPKEANLDLVKEALNTYIPKWARRITDPIIKYKDFEEYKQKSTLFYYEL